MLISKKSLASKSFAKTKEGVADFHMPSFVRRICLVVTGWGGVGGGSVAASAPLLSTGGCVNAKVGVFFLLVCLLRRLGSKWIPWVTLAFVLTRLLRD